MGMACVFQMLSGNTELEVVFFKCEMILNPQASEARVGLYYDTGEASKYVQHHRPSLYLIEQLKESVNLLLL